MHLEGARTASGMGGVLSQPPHEVQISVLPTAIPEVIMVDVSELEIGQSLRLIDVPAPEGVEFLDDLEGTVIAIVSAPISEAELEGEPAEGEEGEEGEEGVEGEEAARPPKTRRRGLRGSTRRVRIVWADRRPGQPGSRIRPRHGTTLAFASRIAWLPSSVARGAASSTARSARCATATSGSRSSSPRRG